MDEKMLKKILSNIRCESCGQYCDPENIRVIGRHNDVWIISVHCSSCNHGGLVTAIMKEGEVPEKVVTELTEAEMRKFSTPISSDDVLDMQIFLNDL